MKGLATLPSLSFFLSLVFMVFPPSPSPCLHQGMAAEKGMCLFCQHVSLCEAKGRISLFSVDKKSRTNRPGEEVTLVATTTTIKQIHTHMQIRAMGPP